jgi:hypothetical protein
MHLTQGGSVQWPLTNGPRGWAAIKTPRPTGPIFQPLMDWLHGHALQEVVTRNPKLEVSASRTRWPISNVATLAGKHLACYRLNQVKTPSWTPINTHLPMELKTPCSTCSSPLLKVLV